MKLRLNKLMAGLVMAGGALALVGCGGGDAPTLVLKSDATVQVTKNDIASIASTKALVEAGTGDTVFEMPSNITFQEVDGESVVGTTSTTAPPVITFKPTTDTSSVALADFSMTDGSGGIVEGTVDAGSCRFRVKNSNSPRFLVNKTYRIVSCQLKALSNGAPVGGSTLAALALILDNIPSKASAKTITITVTAGPGNTAVVTVNGQTVGSVPLPTAVN